MNNFLSMEDLEYLSDYNKKCTSPRKKQNFFNYTSNTIYREYEKQNNDIFIATDKYYISECLKKINKQKESCSASTVYRILRTFGESRLQKTVKEEKIN